MNTDTPKNTTRRTVTNGEASLALLACCCVIGIAPSKETLAEMAALCHSEKDVCDAAREMYYAGEHNKVFAALTMLRDRRKADRG